MMRGFKTLYQKVMGDILGNTTINYTICGKGTFSNVLFYKKQKFSTLLFFDWQMIVIYLCSWTEQLKWLYVTFDQLLTSQRIPVFHLRFGGKKEYKLRSCLQVTLQLFEMEGVSVVVMLEFFDGVPKLIFKII